MVSNTIRDANNQLNLSGSSGGWEVRHVGFRGRRRTDNPVLAIACRNANQTGIVEGCYFGDGGVGPGIWVAPEHAGEIIIRNCYFEGWGDNALYGSAPGNHSNHTRPGRGGVVKVENCYSINNAISNFRLGTDGSYLKDSVSVNPGSGGRGYWGFYETTQVINCDILGANAPNGAIATGTSRWGPATVNLRNTRFTGKIENHHGGGSVNGSSQGHPRDYYPGVPLSPEAARDGNLTGGGGQNPPSLDDVIDRNGENEITIRPQ